MKSVLYQCMLDVLRLWLRYIWLTKNSNSHDLDQNIFLTIKSSHKIHQNSVLLYFYQFISNISHIWCCQKYCGTYRVLVQSIFNSVHEHDEWCLMLIAQKKEQKKDISHCFVFWNIFFFFKFLTFSHPGGLYSVIPSFPGFPVSVGTLIYVCSTRGYDPGQCIQVWESSTYQYHVLILLTCLIMLNGQQIDVQNMMHMFTMILLHSSQCS